jgi:hypothetical protein
MVDTTLSAARSTRGAPVDRAARLDSRLRDAAGWRAVAYVLVKLPVALSGLYTVSWWWIRSST